MISRKLKLVFGILFILPLIAIGQAANFDLPVNKYHTRDNFYNSSWDYMRKNHLRVGYMFAYNPFYFLNDNFANRLQEKDIEQGFGFSTGLRILLFKPVYMDVQWVHTEFSMEKNTPFDGEIIGLNGLEGMVNIQLLPSAKRLSPYVGVGILYVNLDEKQEPYYDYMFKVGTMFHVAPGLSLFGEYKQSLLVHGKYANNQYACGLMIDILYLVAIGSSL